MHKKGCPEVRWSVHCSRRTHALLLYVPLYENIVPIYSTFHKPTVKLYKCDNILYSVTYFFQSDMFPDNQNWGKKKILKNRRNDVRMT